MEKIDIAKNICDDIEKEVTKKNKEYRKVLNTDLALASDDSVKQYIQAKLIELRLKEQDEIISSYRYMIASYERADDAMRERIKVLENRINNTNELTDNEMIIEALAKILNRELNVAKIIADVTWG